MMQAELPAPSRQAGAKGRSAEERVHTLARGTRVGAWRVKAFQGHGSYGAVYRAERAGWRRSEPGALKVSLSVWNWRMEREVELLSRLDHPCIPRLLDRGGPLSPSSDEYPFFVMQWVQGTPLYVWAERHSPSAAHVCRVLAHLSRALEAVHAAGAVHRDVKGDNVLVRLSDKLPVLVDFGSCHFAGAQRLTRQSLPPGTPEYLSPQAVLFYIHSLRHPDGYYPPSPADDLYALGVTAYRLVMGQYPPRIDARQDEHGAWHASSPNIRPLLESNPRVVSGMRELILQLLSEAPEARGTAGQVAQALEALANEPEAQRLAEPQPAAAVPPPNQRVRPPAQAWAWKHWLALAAVGVCALLLWTVQPAPFPARNESSGPRQSSASQAPDAGTAAVGEALPTEPQTSPPSSTEKKTVTQEPLPESHPGQLRPDKKGRCSGRKQVPINGGCWLELLSMTAEECVENNGVIFNGKCYAPAPALPRKPQPTSNPSEAR